MMRTGRPPTALSAIVAALMTAGLAAMLASGMIMAQEGTSLPSPQILVGLTKAARVTLSSSVPVTLGCTAAGPAPPLTAPAGATVTLFAAGSGISWQLTAPGGATQAGHSDGTVIFGQSGSPPQPEAGQAVIGVGPVENATANIEGRSYRGSMLAIPSSGAVLLANAVDIEDYVKSTAGAEMPDGWHVECQKAQAVAVRTYAAYKLGLTKGGAFDDCEGRYSSVTESDVRLWASDQVYRGVEEENPLSVAATVATRGVVLTSGSAPAASFYHADAGGVTEEPRHVWAGGSALPYLRSVEEVPHDSPYARWTVRLTGPELLGGLGSLGIIPAPLPDIIAGSRVGASGRWAEVSVMTARGPATISATQFRGAFPEVRSMLFSSFSLGGGMEARGLLCGGLAAYVQSDVQLCQVRLKDAAVAGGGGTLYLPSQGAYVTGGAVDHSPLTYVLQGSGWGHGVGMSQYGAKAMAESGSDACTILGLYYPGTMVEQWW